jgi:hypothetical protein
MPTVVVTPPQFFPSEVADQEQCNGSQKISHHYKKQRCALDAYHCRAGDNPSLRAE